ncbi:hypothetical protein EHS86_18710, partial [Erwinia amylovora]
MPLQKNPAPATCACGGTGAPSPPATLPRHRRCGNRGNPRRAAGKIPCTVTISPLLNPPPSPPVRLPPPRRCGTTGHRHRAAGTVTPHPARRR